MRCAWLALCVLATGCGGSGTSPDLGAEYGDAPIIPAADLAQAQAAIDRATVTCKVTTGCRPAVGMIAIPVTQDRGAGIGLCTGTLISPSVIATNSHCVPPQLRFEGQELGGDFVLPELPGMRSQRVKLSRVLKASRILSTEGTYVRISPDYAFIALDRAVEGRQPVPVSYDGLEDELPVTIHKMDPGERDAKEIHTAITEAQCVVTQRTLIDPQFDDRYRRVGTLSRCKSATSIQHGNSGSLVVDSQGRARAVLQGGTEGDVQAVYTSNLACVAGVPGFEREQLPQACQLRNGSDSRRQRERLEELKPLLMAEMVRAATQRWSAGEFKRATETLEWGLTENGTFGRIAPKCYRQAAMAKLQASEWVVPAGDFTPKSSKMTADLRGLEISLGVEREEKFTLKLSAAQLKDAQAGREIGVTWAGGAVDSALRKDLPSRIMACSP